MFPDKAEGKMMNWRLLIPSKCARKQPAFIRVYFGIVWRNEYGSMYFASRIYISIIVIIIFFINIPFSIFYLVWLQGQG